MGDDFGVPSSSVKPSIHAKPCEGGIWERTRWKDPPAENETQGTNGPLIGMRDCSYCGGIHPEDALALLSTGKWHLGMTDKNYKAYLEPNERGISRATPPAKVYFYHTDEAGFKTLMAAHRGQSHECKSPRRWQMFGTWDSRYASTYGGCATCTACLGPKPADLIAAIKAGRVKPFATAVEKAAEHGDHAVFISQMPDGSMGSLVTAEMAHCTPEEWAAISDAAHAANPATIDDIKRQRGWDKPSAG